MAEGPRKGQGPLLAVLLLTMVMGRRTKRVKEGRERWVRGGGEGEEGGRRRGR